MGKQIYCQKLQQEAESLDFAPLPGDLGQKILAEISKSAWDGWLSHQTMLINEYRLDLSDAEARKFLLTELSKYLFEGGAEKPSGFVPK